MPKKQLSITDYARSLGVTRQAVLKQIKEKRLPKGVAATRFMGRYWVITMNC